MVLLRRYAAGLLCAAGSLGLASSVQAGPPVPPQSVRVTGSVKATPGQLRLEAMKVEMAWLADMTTYGLPLEVHVEPEGLRVSGRVPDDGARQQALQVARQACCVPVTDGLCAAHTDAPAPGEARSLEVAARSALRHHLAEAATRMQVRVDDKGVISLRGEVATVEDKLNASRCLKGLTGCTAVQNSLTVTPLQHAGHTVTVITRDGQHAVHGTIQVSGEAAQAPALPSGPATAGPAAPGIMPQPQTAPAPLTLPPTPSPTIPSGLPVSLPHGQAFRGTHPHDVRPIRYISPSGYATTVGECQGQQGCEVKARGTHLQVVQSQSRPSFWERLTSFSRSKREPEVVRTTYATPSEPPMVTPPAAQPASPPAAQAASWPKAHTTAPAEPTPARPVSRPLSNLVRVQPKPPATPASAPAPAVPAAPQVTPITQLTPVVMKAEEPAVAPVVKVSSKGGSLAPEEIMKVVQEHCGKLAREVQVEVYKEGATVVKVFAPSANEGPLVSRLLGLPALGAGVKVQVVLGR